MDKTAIIKHKKALNTGSCHFLTKLWLSEFIFIKLMCYEMIISFSIVARFQVFDVFDLEEIAADQPDDNLLVTDVFLIRLRGQ